MVTLDQFIAEIETIFSNYAETGDIDRISIKTWVIERLRKFGKNICDFREEVVEVKNSRALLPENFKSLHLAIKISQYGQPTVEDTSILYKQYIENPAIYDAITDEYIVNYCESKVITERLFTNKKIDSLYYRPELLSLTGSLKSDSIDAKCVNLRPNIRNNYPNKISITSRTLLTNFKEGKVYIQYNSLPVDEEGEIVIPILTTGDILKYIQNYVKIQIAENLILNNKNPQGVSQLLSYWLQQDRVLELNARSEANWSGLSENWDRKYYKKSLENRNLYNLPRRKK